MPIRYGKDFVPKEFEIPEVLETDKFKLRMLTTNDVDKDYEAVMSSLNHLKGVFGGYASTWPPNDLTKKQDLTDIAWHQLEFQNKRSFAYTVMNLDESKCLGCVYIFPSEKKEYDAIVIFWVRKEHTRRDISSINVVYIKWVNERG